MAKHRSSGMYPWGVQMASQHFDHWIVAHFRTEGRYWTAEFEQMLRHEIHDHLKTKVHCDEEDCQYYGDYIFSKWKRHFQRYRPDLFTTRAQRAAERLDPSIRPEFLLNAKQFGVREAQRMQDEQEYLSEIACALMNDDPEDL